ncbi:hypothetical protein LINPERPRIM_LOCUS21057 [Linum perenne]
MAINFHPLQLGSDWEIKGFGLSSPTFVFLCSSTQKSFLISSVSETTMAAAIQPSTTSFGCPPFSRSFTRLGFPTTTPSPSIAQPVGLRSSLACSGKDSFRSD